MNKKFTCRLLVLSVMVLGGFALPICHADQDLSDLCAGAWKGSFFMEKSHDKDRIRERGFSLVYRSSDDAGGKEGVLELTPSLDLTKCRALKFWVYSERPTPGTITIALSSGVVEGKDNYFYYKMKSNFEGWKEVLVPLADFKKVREASWSNIASVKLWDFSGNPVAKDTALYFNDMKLIQSE